MQAEADRVFIKPELVDYIVALISATRKHPMLDRGASPRATLAVAAMAKAMAFLNGRDYVVPDDVKTVYCETVAHRLLLSPEAEARDLTAEGILREILEKTPAPALR